MSVASAFVDDTSGPGRPVVLLVDDDEVNLMITSLSLRDRGFEVIEAAGGEQALDILVKTAVDIVVLDAVMPGLDGFATCVRLRAMPTREHLPVLMLTGLDDEASIRRAYEVGATDFFVKSPQWSLLEGRLRYLLRSSRTRHELVRSRARLARAQDLARMGSFDWHPLRDRWEGQLEFSDEVLRLLGMPPGARPTLKKVLRMVPRGERDLLLRRFKDMREHRSVLATDVVLVLDDGRRRVMHVEAEPDADAELAGDLQVYTGIVQDVTDRRTAEDKIRHLANYDMLTGLPNRRQLIWRAEKAIDYAARYGHLCALLLIDLDRFKVINDTLGHAAGDELLGEVAHRLRACVRHNDRVVEAAVDGGIRAHRTLESVGRLGGDEFVALLPEIAHEDDAQIVAQRILEALHPPIHVGQQECFVTASVGVALFPRDGKSVLDLLRNSDVAMYAAKEAGRNVAAVFSPNLSHRGKERLALESDLHKSLERDELVLFYQPKIEPGSVSMVGVEALMRWRRGNTLVPPGDFIPLAEESGLIIPMSEWALREATRQTRLWQEHLGRDVSIAVNLPTRLFSRPDLVGHIESCARANGVPLSLIQLEITETGLMKNIGSVLSAMQQLHEGGVKISVDDFGTGYSSLSYLTSLPISELKIDGSFVRKLGQSAQSNAVATAIVALAGSLDLTVVAEGVETIEQMQTLWRLGCRQMQGFLFSRALPADQLERWFEETLLARHAAWIGVAAPPESSHRSAAASRN